MIRVRLGIFRPIHADATYYKSVDNISARRGLLQGNLFSPFIVAMPPSSIHHPKRKLLYCDIEVDDMTLPLTDQIEPSSLARLHTYTSFSMRPTRRRNTKCRSPDCHVVIARIDHRRMAPPLEFGALPAPPPRDISLSFFDKRHFCIGLAYRGIFGQQTSDWLSAGFLGSACSKGLPPALNCQALTAERRAHAPMPRHDTVCRFESRF